ncbi:MAG: flagellar protein FlaG [Phenylobacterium sp.]|uniref:flagellar protein FlaG n=1 Tax=Phenylobacterium sp. TaxID=1871053 RepID=UPI0025ED5870|nr:flagellar protein FlaG [Phenylobacterium sp.]MCG9916261.1 flagellar protein FlaG [Phenylobacterium sp.]
MAATNRASFERTPPPVARPVPEAAPRPAAKSEQADLRLIIEEDAAVGAYVYKTVDRHTGEVVSQIPREEVLKMRDRTEYEVGDVVKTQA